MRRCAKSLKTPHGCRAEANTPDGPGKGMGSMHEPRGSWRLMPSWFNRELIDFMMGPQPVSQRRSPERAISEAEAAGLVVDDLRQEALPVTFNDVAAVVYFLRKVIWAVPGFTVEGYRRQLVHLHNRIKREGPFVTYAERLLVKARKRA